MPRRATRPLPTGTRITATLTVAEHLALVEHAVTVAVNRVLDERAAKAPAFMTLTSASRYAHRKIQDVSDAIHSGALKAQRLGWKWQTSEADVKAWITAGCPTTAPAIAAT